MQGLQFYKKRYGKRYTDFSIHCWRNDKGQIHFYGNSDFSFGLEKAKKIRDKLNEAIAQVEVENLQNEFRSKD